MITLKGVLALAIGIVNIVIFIYMERKVIADMQVRFGPMRVGPHGTLQPIADVIKLLAKEDIVPAAADRLLFILAPFIAFVPAFMLYLTIPISENLVVADLPLGIFYLFGILTVVPVSVLIAGWSSHSKYALLGGLRGAAQQISYEIPLLASILGVIMLTGSFSLVDIVKAQQVPLIKLGAFTILPRWFIFLQPFGFLFYFTAALADTQRTPFDMPEAESELVQGYNTEYSSIKFALFFLGEYSNALIISALSVIIFFGGWSGFGPIPGVVWFFLKTYVFVYFIIWLRSTLPRIRIDQLMDMGWKILLPLTLVNIIVTGFLMIGR
ncbi:MAG: NADH-quinone oxidoreductase subunit NuoH [Actinomycetota bacterium]|nr:NADH-quinone oxidoreductase subunit NuoH [Actinomycetota bacterium]